MTVQSGPDSIAKLMADFRAGDSRAAATLIELLYPELKLMAVKQMRREWKENSWQPTLLVNELYLEIVKIKALPPADGEANSKAAFLGLAGHMMKRLLIHHARPLASKVQKEPLSENLRFDADTAFLDVEDVLRRLADVKPEMRRVVEMKVFQGLTASEIAERMGCATVSVNRYWQFARRWLCNELCA